MKLAEIKKDYGFKVFHYCFMQTHVHMIVEIQDIVQFSEGMKVLKRAYAHQYNKARKRFGPVWRDRYKSKLIENETYLYACGNYVEHNPVAAGIVDKAIDWPHSSSRYYELGEKDAIIDHYDHVQSGSKQMWGRREFEKMRAIGSEWFQYQVQKRLRG